MASNKCYLNVITCDAQCCHNLYDSPSNMLYMTGKRFIFIVLMAQLFCAIVFVLFWQNYFPSGSVSDVTRMFLQHECVKIQIKKILKCLTIKRLKTNCFVSVHTHHNKQCSTCERFTVENQSDNTLCSKTLGLQVPTILTQYQQFSFTCLFIYKQTSFSTTSAYTQYRMYTQDTTRIVLISAC